MNTEAALRTLARHRRRMAEARMDTEFAKLRRRLARQEAVRRAAANCAYTIGYVLMTAAAVILLWLYGF